MLALSLIKGVGPHVLRALLMQFNSAGSALSASDADLEQVDGVSSLLAETIVGERAAALRSATEQMELASKDGARVLDLDNPAYPRRLKRCEDAPPVLFVKGNVNFETAKFLAVVGTRQQSEESEIVVEQQIGRLAKRHPDLVIVSGLAYGVDICAHRAALKAGRSTLCVLAHGFQTLYPSRHRKEFKQMLEKNGGAVTQFTYGEKASRYNFLMRNSVIAGLCDATLVMESGDRGGSLNTAAAAHEYKRTVLAVPGYPSRKKSAGCNNLIRSGVAQPVFDANDIDRILGWQLPAELADGEAVSADERPQPETPNEKALVAALRTEDGLTVAQLMDKTSLSVSVVSCTLIQMEMRGIVRGFPGNMFRLLI